MPKRIVLYLLTTGLAHGYNYLTLSGSGFR